jgi:hypothetical protein
MRDSLLVRICRSCHEDQHVVRGEVADSWNIQRVNLEASVRSRDIGATDRTKRDLIEAGLN